jgi:glycosyltransferase involved in cell wall biosynthesis
VVHAFDLAQPDQVEAALGLADRYDAPMVLTPCSAPAVWPDAARAAAACRAARVIFTITAVEEAGLLASGAMAARFRRIPHACDLVGEPRPARWRRRHRLGGPIVLFVGRRVGFKGYRVLLEASRIVWEVRPDAAFVFIGPDGDDDCAHWFERFADPRIIDLGVVDGQVKHDAVAACTVLCLPTSVDVFPLVFVEAWTRGKPVVSGDFAGADEVVHNGVDGLIVEPRPLPLAAALTRLLIDDDLCVAMGQAGARRAATEFGWDRVAAAYAANYRNILGRTG